MTRNKALSLRRQTPQDIFFSNKYTHAMWKKIQKIFENKVAKNDIVQIVVTASVISKLRDSQIPVAQTINYIRF